MALLTISFKLVACKTTSQVHCRQIPVKTTHKGRQGIMAPGWDIVASHAKVRLVTGRAVFPIHGSQSTMCCL